MKKYFESLNRKTLLVTLLTSAFILTTSVAYASLTLSSTTVSSDGALTLTGNANSTLDLGASHTLSLQTTNNGPITTGSGLFTLGGGLTLGGLTSSGTQCLHISSTGVVSGTGSDCGGSGDMTLASTQTITGAKTFGTIGGAVGKLILAGSTSGSTILNAAAVAGATTIVLPSTSGTIMLNSDDTTGKSAKTDALNSATTVVNIAAATAPTTGQVLTATDSTHATWQAAGGGSGTGTVGNCATAGALAYYALTGTTVGCSGGIALNTVADTTGFYTTFPNLVSTGDAGGTSLYLGNDLNFTSSPTPGHAFIFCAGFGAGCTINAGASGATAFVGDDGSNRSIIGNTAGDSYHLVAVGTSVDCESNDGVCIGHGATAKNPSDVVIAASDTGTAGGNVLIRGTNTSSGGNHVILGTGTAAGTSNSGILIGTNNCTITSINEAIGIGYGACPTATGHVVLGGSQATDFYVGTEGTPVRGHFSTVIENPPITKTANYNPNLGDTYVIFNCSGTCQVGLGNIATAGYKITFITYAAQAVNSFASNVMPLTGSGVGTAILPATSGKWVTLVYDGSQWDAVAGN